MYEPICCIHFFNRYVALARTLNSIEVMGPYRLIAIDLDGTLLSPKGLVTPRARDAVRSALSAGLLVCFATGRNLAESTTALDAIEHYGTAVFVGGAMVIDTGKKITLHRQMMQPELAREICGLLEAEGHAVLALVDDGSAGTHYLASSGIPLDEATVQWMHVAKAMVQHAGRLGEYAHPSTVRIGIASGVDRVLALKEKLIERFGSRIVLHNLRVPGYPVEVLEIFDPAVNKWEGVLHVARRHGVLPAQIVAIGDDLNDIPMLRGAGLGVAMGNARDEVKAAADRVIGANEHEGLAEFLEELVSAHLVEPIDRRAEPTAT
jgi:HAD superfamily hydrolase (TIGR01484 family)